MTARIDEELPPGISVVIPVYNSESSLEILAERLIPELQALDSCFEVILVNDASKDDSWNRSKLLARTHPELRAISLSRNFGQHPAILAGMRSAKFATTVTMDDDLQHRPDEICKLREALTDDVDLVYGIAEEEEHGFWRSLASRGVKASLGAAVGADTASKASAFRLFRTSLRGAFDQTTDPYVSIDVLMSWATTRVAAVNVGMDRRELGTSNYTLGKLTRHASNMLTGFSLIPLRVVTYTGFALGLFGIAVLLYVLISYVARGGSLPGFPFLASIIAIFSGAQLFAFGVLGEYLGRIHFRSMQRPPYVIREEVT